MSERNDSLVAEYLARVSRATAGLPADRRDELVSDLREHIETSRADLSAETEAEVRGILDRLGDPAAIARAAAEDAGLAATGGTSDVVEVRSTADSSSRRRLWLIVAILGVIVLLLLVMAALYFTHSSESGAAMALITGAVPAG
ncbi:HAAS signaling domain-containing protein [Lentzea sp. NPDC051213]|uniref:HAAS signaling domain-containing protein n=1 Tax=Lentzea sp. NPDC051213 TaxID=3364126 RepID=UPI0037A93EBF